VLRTAFAVEHSPEKSERIKAKKANRQAARLEVQNMERWETESKGKSMRTIKSKSAVVSLSVSVVALVASASLVFGFGGMSS
jgi:hypothetical protein